MLEINNFYDQTEVHVNVTVQVLTNSKTGRTSIAWSDNENVITDWVCNTQVLKEHDPVVYHFDEDCYLSTNIIIP